MQTKQIIEKMINQRMRQIQNKKKAGSYGKAAPPQKVFDDFMADKYPWVVCYSKNGIKRKLDCKTHKEAKEVMLDLLQMKLPAWVEKAKGD